MAYPVSLKFTRDHEWIDVKADRARIGITDYAQQQLGDVVHMELPTVGAMLRSGQSFGTVESVKAVYELFAPVSGEVVEVNEGLRQKPELINSDPYGHWMIAVRLTDPTEMDALLDSTQYADLVK